jgi:hypothetical protein
MAWPSLQTRIIAGVSILAALAAFDLYRNRRNATRWREYAVLLACCVGAIAYGVVNDQITSSISWEYFYYGKDLDRALGPRVPPDPLKLHLFAALVGVKATGSAGLIIGVVLLVANNPSRKWPRLSNVQLVAQLSLIFAITAAVASVGGVLGYFGMLKGWHEDFEWMVRGDHWRPARFMAVYGVHLGGYLGAVIGLGLAVVRIRWRRKRSRKVAKSAKTGNVI